MKTRLIFVDTPFFSMNIFLDRKFFWRTEFQLRWNRWYRTPKGKMFHEGQHWICESGEGYFERGETHLITVASKDRLYLMKLGGSDVWTGASWPHELLDEGWRPLKSSEKKKHKIRAIRFIKG
jgi:hypothetical protein